MRSDASLPKRAEAPLTPGPRFATPRREDRPTRGPIVTEVARLCGWDFFPWQRDAVDVAMEYHAVSKLPYFQTVGVSVARQNGKTTLVLARVATQLIMPKQTIAYTAQERALARIKWTEHVEVLMESPFKDRVAYVDTANHREMLVMKNGSRYLPVTPNPRKTGRSLSLDLAVIDEAFSHRELGIVGAVKGTMAARPRAQIWLLSNAGDDDSKLWRHYTDLGRLEAENPASTFCWIEYGPDPKCDVFDRRAWAEANPSMGLPHGVSAEFLADAALTMTEDVFRREHLNLWRAGSLSAVIDKVTWAACYVEELVPGDRFCLGLDITPERDRAALVAAGVVRYEPEDGEPEDRTALDVLESSSDIERVIARTIQVAKRHDVKVIIDRGGPAASAIAALEKAGVTVRLIPMTELANACGDFYDATGAARDPGPAVEDDDEPAPRPVMRIAHRGDFRLTDALTSAGKRPLGDKWVWKRRGGGDISPLIAATMARWGAVSEPEPRTSAYDDENELTVV